MTIKEQMRKDREAFRDSSPKEKLQFFLDYYKWPLLTVVIAAVLVSSLIGSVARARETALSGIFLNCFHDITMEPYLELETAFLEAQQLDPARFELDLNATLTFDPGDEAAAQDNYNTAQLIGMEIAAHELDFIVGDMTAMKEFARSASFQDLSEVLTPQQLAALESQLVYVDQVGAVLLDVSGWEHLTGGYPYLQEPLVLAVAVNAPHTERIAALIAFAAEE